jgi:hypothetical protein
VPTEEDFDRVGEQYHLALGEFMRGSAEAAKSLFSQEDDVTSCSPFGPFARGWKQVVEAMERAASNTCRGDAIGFDRIAMSLTPGRPPVLRSHLAYPAARASRYTHLTCCLRPAK